MYYLQYYILYRYKRTQFSHFYDDIVFKMYTIGSGIWFWGDKYPVEQHDLVPILEIIRDIFCITLRNIFNNASLKLDIYQKCGKRKRLLWFDK